MNLERLYDKAEKYAARLGAEHGRNAAEWYIQDAFGGRVTRGAKESAERIAKGIEEGDCMVLDSLPRPDLSGQWADDMTGPDLVDDAIAETGVDSERHERIYRAMSENGFTDICDAYENAFNEACEHAIAKAAESEAQS